MLPLTLVDKMTTTTRTKGEREGEEERGRACGVWRMGRQKAVLKDESFALLLILELNRRGAPYALIHT